MYFPHRNYADISPECDEKQAFLRKQNHFDQLALTSCHSSPSIENAVRAIQLSNLSEYGEVLQDVHDCVQASDQEPVVIESFSDFQDNETHVHVDQQYIEQIPLDENQWHSLCNGIDSNNLIDMHQKLTCDQRRVFNYVRKCFEEQSTFYIFITGGAGIGKSYLTTL